MYTIKNYCVVQSLQEAGEVLRKPGRNRVIAGGTWLRMSDVSIGTAIDLTKLNLDTVERIGDEIRIGAMATLRTVEMSDQLRRAFSGAVSDSVRPIVGVQFRNCATIGAGIYNGYGFSDPLCALLALDAEVELLFAGRMKLSRYLAVPRTKDNRDILTYIYLHDDGSGAAWQSFRYTETDFAILNLCLMKSPEGAYRVAVGARPGRAMLCDRAAELLSAGDVEGAKAAVADLPFGDNLAASAAYRRALSGVLLERAFREVTK